MASNRTDATSTNPWCETLAIAPPMFELWAGGCTIRYPFFTNMMTTSMVFVALSAIADDFGVTPLLRHLEAIIEALIISAILKRAPLRRLWLLARPTRVATGPGLAPSILSPSLPLAAILRAGLLGAIIDLAHLRNRPFLIE